MPKEWLTVPVVMMVRSVRLKRSGYTAQRRLVQAGVLLIIPRMTGRMMNMDRLVLIGSAIVFALTLTCPVSSLAQDPPGQEGLTALRAAQRQLEDADADQAIATLRALLDNEPSPSVRWIAQVTLFQLDGSFVERQAAWLDRKVVDVVMLVRNEQQFIEAISQWTDEQFWPVLIEDGWLAPMFIRAFNPQRVVTWPTDRPSVTADQNDDTDAVTDRLAAALVVHARRLADRTGPRPPGLVMTTPLAPQRTAALALALGRMQPAVMLDEISDPPQRVIDRQRVRRLNRQVVTQLARHDLLEQGAWCGLTLGAPWPYRYRTSEESKDLMAVDDWLGRAPDGRRVAVVGRLAGAPDQAVFQAMSSLFLQPERALLFDDYDNRGPALFQQYRLAHAAEVLGEMLHVTFVQQASATLPRFRQLTRLGESFDLYWINTSGGNWHWQIRGRATADDLPIDWPAAYYLVHSFSAANPFDVRTVAGRALAGGGYWYFGSVHEPYLHAFAMPGAAASKMAAGSPLAFALRLDLSLPSGSPWKLMLIGDPLFALRDNPAERINAGAFDGIDWQDWQATGHDSATRALREAAVNQSANLAGIAHRWLQLHLQHGEADASNNPALDGSDLARALMALYDAERFETLAKVPPVIARQHPIASALVWRCAARRFEQLMRHQQLDKAAEYLPSVLELGGEARQLIALIEPWADAMIRSGRGDEARALLEPYRDRAWHGQTRQLSRNMLKKMELPSP
jgi:hypothetical protein